MNTHMQQSKRDFAKKYDAPLLAHVAVSALLAEVDLTPKPALVDRRGSGVHKDMTLKLMERSAWALLPVFTAIAIASIGRLPDQSLRMHLADVGRAGEEAMLAATGGVNTHRGAIWSLGLLIAGAVVGGPSSSPERIAILAGTIARHEDRAAPPTAPHSHGRLMQEKHGVRGARGEAQGNFSTVIEWGLPTLWAARQHGASENHARLDALMALMAHLDDTCILYRGGEEALRIAKEGAREVLRLGGTEAATGYERLLLLERQLVPYNASPGGSADLLAATIFLDILTDSQAIWKNGTRIWKK